MLTSVTGEKGGTGKSVVCRCVVDYHILHGGNPLVIDTDTSNPDVARSFLGENRSGKGCDVLALDTATETGSIRLIDSILAAHSQSRDVVINCPARDPMSKADFGAALNSLCNEESLDMRVLWVMDADQICVEQLLKFLKILSQPITIIKNLGMVNNDPARFNFLESMKISKRLPSVFFPKLTDSVINALKTPNCKALHELDSFLSMGARYMSRRCIESARNAISEAIEIAAVCKED